MAKSKTLRPPAPVISLERIAAQIYVARGEQVMLDSALAALYGVTTAALNQGGGKRNAGRFPADFAFQLDQEESEAFDITNCDIKGQPAAADASCRGCSLSRV